MFDPGILICMFKTSILLQREILEAPFWAPNSNFHLSFFRRLDHILCCFFNDLVNFPGFCCLLTFGGDSNVFRIITVFPDYYRLAINSNYHRFFQLSHAFDYERFSGLSSFGRIINVFLEFPTTTEFQILPDVCGLLMFGRKFQLPPNFFTCPVFWNINVLPDY